jgi:ribosomal protein S18 acetylase RimI-like enzyme
MINTFKIRNMQAFDLDFAAARTAAEGWYSETLLEIAGFYAHDPQGCFIAELDGNPVGMCYGIRYGSFGFLGELIVTPEVRGQGLGQQLFEHTIQYLRSTEAHTVFLDGVLAAVPLYERLGFQKVCRSLRFRGSLKGQSHAHVNAMHSADLKEVFALDAETFGADRSFFIQRRLQVYPTLCKVARINGKIEGYILGRIGHLGISAGPWVATARLERPLDLLEALALEAPLTPLALGCLSDNTKAVESLHSLGFVESPTSPWRMAFGRLLQPGMVEQNFAIGSPAKG